MLFSKKKKKEPEKVKTPQDKTHRIFQLGSIAVISFIIYQFYISLNIPKVAPPTSALVEVESSKDICGECLTREQIKSEMQMQAEQMQQDPEYIKIRNFVQGVESKADKKSGSAHPTADGYLLYIPLKKMEDMLVGEGGNGIIISDEINKFTIDLEVVAQNISEKGLSDSVKSIPKENK